MILAAIGRGDLRGFDTFADRHKGPLFAYCRARLGDAGLAEDVTQETFLRAFRFAARHGPPESEDARPWLFTIARHCVDDYLRAKRRRPLRLVDGATLDGVAESPEPGAAMEVAEELMRLRAALKKLPEEQLEVVRLRLHGELSTSQMADVLAIPEGTVKSRMRYAIQKLRGVLCPEENTR